MHTLTKEKWNTLYIIFKHTLGTMPTANEYIPNIEIQMYETSTDFLISKKRNSSSYVWNIHGPLWKNNEYAINYKRWIQTYFKRAYFRSIWKHIDNIGKTTVLLYISFFGGFFLIQ